MSSWSLSFLRQFIYDLFFCDAHPVTPNIWIGNYKAALNYAFIQSNHIDVIVNCTKDIPFIACEDTEQFDLLSQSEHKARDVKFEPTEHKLNDMQMYRLDVNDSLLECDLLKMEEHMKYIIPLLKEHIEQGRIILVHCYAGKQRSAIVVAALLFELIQSGTIVMSNEPLFEEYYKKANVEEKSAKHTLLDCVFAYIVKRRPSAFTFGFRINFLKSIVRYLNM